MPLGIGTEKLACADAALGGDGVEWPLTGSWSMSIELRPLMADCDNAERRLRSSGGKLSGWVLVSIFFLREEDEDVEPGSVECREARDGRGCFGGLSM